MERRRRFVELGSKSFDDSSKQRKVQVRVTMQACLDPRVAEKERQHNVASVELGVVSLILVTNPPLHEPISNAH